MTNNIKKIENAFVSNMGSGKIAAARLLELITFVTKGDSRNIVSALFRLRKNGDKGSQTVQQIVALIFPKANIKTAKDKKSLVIVLGDSVDNDALDRFKNAVKDGLSIRGNLLAAIKGETEAPKFDLSKFAEQIAKRIDKEDITEASLVAAINTQVKALIVAKASKRAA